MTDEAMSPLRRRMIEDMTIRKLGGSTFATAVLSDEQPKACGLSGEGATYITVLPDEHAEALGGIITPRLIRDCVPDEAALWPAEGAAGEQFRVPDRRRWAPPC